MARKRSEPPNRTRDVHLSRLDVNFHPVRLTLDSEPLLPKRAEHFQLAATRNCVYHYA